MDISLYAMLGLGLAIAVALAWMGRRRGLSTKRSPGLLVASLLAGAAGYMAVVIVDAAVASTRFDGTCSLMMQGSRPCGIVEYVTNYVSMAGVVFSPLFAIFVLSFLVPSLIASARAKSG